MRDNFLKPENHGRAKLGNQKPLTGFTLIELLVVITIIGILATIIMNSLSLARAQARDVRRVADIRQLTVALEMYYGAQNRFPADLAALAPVYISTAPIDPDGISEYQYCTPANGSKYHLGAREQGLEMEDSTILLNDADVENDGCGASSFSGEDPVYDVKF